MRITVRAARVGIVAALLFGTLAIMAAGAGSDAAVASLDRAIRRHERLHFGLHLAAGRVLSLCPCTRDRAAVQYWKASAHAPSARERALVTNERPQRVRDGPGDLVALSRYGVWVAIHSSEARTALGLLGLSLSAVAVARRTRRSGEPAI